jgi:hypothetical protein
MKAAEVKAAMEAAEATMKPAAVEPAAAHLSVAEFRRSDKNS